MFSLTVACGSSYSAGLCSSSSLAGCLCTSGPACSDGVCIGTYSSISMPTIPRGVLEFEVSASGLEGPGGRLAGLKTWMEKNPSMFRFVHAMFIFI